MISLNNIFVIIEARFEKSVRDVIDKEDHLFNVLYSSNNLKKDDKVNNFILERIDSRFF